VGRKSKWRTEDLRERLVYFVTPLRLGLRLARVLSPGRRANDDTDHTAGEDASANHLCAVTAAIRDPVPHAVRPVGIDEDSCTSDRRSCSKDDRRRRAAVAAS